MIDIVPRFTVITSTPAAIMSSAYLWVSRGIVEGLEFLLVSFIFIIGLILTENYCERKKIKTERGDDLPEMDR